MDKRYALPLTAALGGAAACVLRLLQNHTGYEADTGLPIPGNFAALALAVLLIGLAAALALTAQLLPAEEEPGPILPRDFSTENAGLLTIPMCGVFLLALSGLSDLAESASLLPEGLVSSRHVIYSILRAGGLGFSLRGQTLLGVLTLAAAVSLFPVLAGCRRREGHHGANTKGPLRHHSDSCSGPGGATGADLPHRLREPLLDHVLRGAAGPGIHDLGLLPA